MNSCVEQYRDMINECARFELRQETSRIRSRLNGKSIKVANLSKLANKKLQKIQKFKE